MPFFLTSCGWLHSVVLTTYFLWVYHFLLMLPFFIFTHSFVGPGQLSRYSDSLWAGQSGDQILVGMRFSTPTQKGPGVHYSGYRVSFPGIKQPGCGVDHPPPSNAKVKGRVELYLCSPSGPSWPFLG